MNHQLNLLECIDQLRAGPLRFAAIAFDRGELWLRDSDGACAIVHIDAVSRDEDLLSRLSPSDAFRVGIEWQSWFTKQTFELVARELSTHASPAAS